MADLAAGKRAMRARLQSARAARSDSLVTSAALAEVIGTLPSLRGRIVCAYVPVRGEPGSIDVLEALVSHGARVLLPITFSREEPLAWGWFGSLVEGPFGLLQPAAAEPSVSAADADWVGVPALAIDQHGHRLGKGAGHYDRAIASVSPDRLVGVVYDEEFIDGVPAEPHDRPVGWVLTPYAGLRRLSAESRGY